MGLLAGVQRLLVRRGFFAAVLIVFGLETIWVIATLAYPGIFDESWHYQIIQQYARQWSPMLLHQDPQTYTLGALVHDPSFLFYYVMSLIYRLVSLVTQNDTARIIVLRVIDMVLFGLALVISRKAFLQAGVSRAVVHAGLAFFVLVPVVPFLAAQINNDNLVMVWSALSFWLVIRVERQRRAGVIRVDQLAWLVTCALAGAMTQYVFLPVSAAAVAYAAFVVWQALLTPTAWRLRLSRWSAIKKTSAPLRSWRGAFAYGAVTLAMIGTGLSYGVNLVKYHSPTPSCNDILTTQQCLTYYTFNRNYTDHATKPPVSPNPVSFTGGWLYRIYTTSFYTALNGSDAPLQVVPLPLPALTAAVIALVGACLALYHWRWFARRYPGLMVCVVVSLFFCATFWVYSYQGFLYYRDKVGINGRYLFPIELPLIMTAGVVIAHSLRRYPRVLAGTLLLSALLCIEGGGVALYITASDANWWWPQPQIVAVAEMMQRIIKPLIINFYLFW